MKTELADIYRVYENNEKEILDFYFDLLRFESVSANPECKAQLTSCADWLCNKISEAGLTTELWPTEGYPAIFAEWVNAGPDKPTVLIYTHYDVQPADPIELWETPPFEPNVRNGKVYARGAVDDKGPVAYVVAAIAELLKTKGTLPLNVKLIIEGEEEITSVNLPELLERKKKELKADHLLVVDSGFPDAKTPTITLGLRGLCTLGVTLRGSTIDLHSGIYGGIAYNPLHGMVQILNKLRDENGRITVPGFYDDLIELTEEQKSTLNFDIDLSSVLNSANVKPTGGEKEFSPIESNWMRPTLELNGLSGGYSGEGSKTVIPAIANAKISCRLVANQNPEKIEQQLINYISSLVPDGLTIEFERSTGFGVPFFTDPTNSATQILKEVYSEVYKKPCKAISFGASIPIVPTLAKASQSEAIIVGNALPEDGLHSPNESFDLHRFKEGFAVIWRALEALS